MTRRVLWLCACALIAACGDDASTDDGAAGSGGEGGAGGAGAMDGPEPDTFEDQVERGGDAYAAHCASCHGAMGEGTADAPAVVGDGVLPLDPPDERSVRTAQFRTALDVFEFVVEAMPGDDPGSLDTATYVDILAFALFANGVELDTPLDADVAADLLLNP